MQLDSKSDGFLVNKAGTLQTASMHYGQVLDPFPSELPPFRARLTS